MPQSTGMLGRFTIVIAATKSITGRAWTTVESMMADVYPNLVNPSATPLSIRKGQSIKTPHDEAIIASPDEKTPDLIHALQESQSREDTIKAAAALLKNISDCAHLENRFN